MNRAKKKVQVTKKMIRKETGKKAWAWVRAWRRVWRQMRQGKLVFPKDQRKNTKEM